MSDIDLRSAVRLAMPPFVTGKLVSLGVGWLTVWNNSRIAGLPSWSVLADHFSNWDGVEYRMAADSGYPSGPLDLSFNSPSLVWGRFPGLPLGVHLLSYPLVSTVLAAIVFNAACELVALTYLVRLARLEGRDEQTAQTAAWLLALFPYAIFLTVFYTEAPFMAAATAALYYMRRGDHGLASLSGLLATAVRVTGLFLIPSMLIERYLHKRRVLDPGLLLTGVVAAPLLLFMLYAQNRTGDAFAYFHVQGSASYNQRFTLPWDALNATYDSAQGQAANQYGAFFATGFVLAFVGIGLVALMWIATIWRRPRIAPSLALYSTVVLMVSLCVPHWGGIARYLMVITPMYILGADMLKGREGVRIGVIAVSGALAAYATSILLSGTFLA